MSGKGVSINHFSPDAPPGAKANPATLPNKGTKDTVLDVKD